MHASRICCITSFNTEVVTFYLGYNKCYNLYLIYCHRTSSLPAMRSITAEQFKLLVYDGIPHMIAKQSLITSDRT